MQRQEFDTLSPYDNFVYALKAKETNRQYSQRLDKLISDCITFGLSVKEGIEYIGREYPDEPISERTYCSMRNVLIHGYTSPC